MRDPKRIDEFCDMLKEYWHEVPDWRFGQLIANVYRFANIQDGFYIEDGQMKEIFRDFFQPINETEEN